MSYLCINSFSTPGDGLNADSDQEMSKTTVSSEIHTRQQKMTFSVDVRNLIIHRFGIMITGDRIEPVTPKRVERICQKP